MSLDKMTVKQLQEVASRKGVKFTSKTKKQELVDAIEAATKTKEAKVEETKPKAVRRGGEY